MTFYFVWHCFQEVVSLYVLCTQTQLEVYLLVVMCTQIHLVLFVFLFCPLCLSFMSLFFWLHFHIQ